jgi:hypothetical protein
MQSISSPSSVINFQVVLSSQDVGESCAVVVGVEERRHWFLALQNREQQSVEVEHASELGTQCPVVSAF